MKVLVYQSHIDEPDARPFRHELAQASKSSFEQYARNMATITNGMVNAGYSLLTQLDKLGSFIRFKD